MEFLCVLFVAAGAVWLAAVWKHGAAIPEWVLPAGVVALLFVEPVFGAEFFRIDLGPLPLSLDRLLLGGLVLLAAHRLWHRPGDRHCWTRLDTAVLLWLAVLTVSAGMGDPGYRDQLPLRRLLFFNFLPASLYFVVRQVSWNENRLGSLMWGLVGLSAWLSATGICEWKGWHGLVFPRHTVNPLIGEFLGRARGPLMNPVINGMLINAGLGAMVLLAWRGDQRARGVAVFLVPLILAGSYATLTRSVWVGSLLTVGLIVFLQVTWRTRVLLCLAAAMLAAAVIGGFGERLNRFKRDRDVTVEEMSLSIGLRPLLATVAWEMFLDRPLTGCGFGQYSRFKTEYHYLDQYDAPLTAALPYMQHNVIGSYATESGLVGLAGLLFLLGSGAGLIWRQKCWNGAGKYGEQVSLLALCVLGNYLVNGMFHDVSIIPACHSQLLLFLGVVAALTAERMRRETGASRCPALVRQAEPAPLLAAGP